MTPQEIVGRRLRSQLLVPCRSRRPEEVVATLGAVQAQDYAGAKWAVGLRAKGSTDDDVEDAFNRGAILRTHVLRPTWHFVTPRDIRWLLALSGPRVHAANASYYRTCGVDSRLAARGTAVFARALRDGGTMTRAELAAALQRAGIAAAGMRLAYLVMQAELDGVICSGPRRGRQFTYALLDDRVPAVPPLYRTEALAEIVRRYFSSHGPATIRDFVWWSGLTVRDAKAGLEEARSSLEEIAIDGERCWFREGPAPRPSPSTSVLLLPNYDELSVAYKDRRALSAVPRPWLAESSGFPHLLMAGGRLVGRWRRTIGPRLLAVEARGFRPLTPRETKAVFAEAERLGRFMTLPVTAAIA